MQDHNVHHLSASAFIAYHQSQPVLANDQAEQRKKQMREKVLHYLSTMESFNDDPPLWVEESRKRALEFKPQALQRMPTSLATGRQVGGL